MIYFDNGATTFPKPKRVKEAVLSGLERYGANPGRSGHKLSLETAMKVFDTREAAADFFGAEAVENVVFTANCTHALNFALKGLLRQGDHVIISDLEHNSVLRPVHELFRRGMITYNIAEVHEGDDDATIASFRRCLQANTRLIATTHGSNVWGIRVPVKKLGALAREADALFLVDAAQTAGVVPIDMQSDGIDFLCAAGHKSLYGPSGTGLLVTPLGSALSTCFEGGTGSMSSDFNQPTDMPDRMESGTVNTCGIIGLGAGIAYVREKSMEAIFRQEMQVAAELYNGLKEIPGVRLYTRGCTREHHLPVLSFTVDGMASEDVVAALSDLGFALRGGLHCAPLAHRKMGTLDSGAVRASIGSFNTRAQAQGLLAAVRRVAKRGG